MTVEMIPGKVKLKGGGAGAVEMTVKMIPGEVRLKGGERLLG